MSNDALQSLLEMGITSDVAQESLSRVNGNLEAAVNLIFSNEMPPDTTASSVEDGSKDSYYDKEAELDTPDHVQLSTNTHFRPGDLSEVIPANGHSQGNMDTDDVQIGSDSYVESDGQQQIVENTVSSEFLPPAYHFIEHSVQKSQISDPTIILPSPPNAYMENYFAFYALFVSMYCPHLISQTDFKDLNYDRDWFKGTSFQNAKYGLQKSEQSGRSSIVPIEDSNADAKLLWLLQRLTAIVNSPISERAYVCAKTIMHVLHSQTQTKLSSSDHLYETLPTFIKSIISTLSLCPNTKEEALKNQFISSAFYLASKDEPVVNTLLSLFHFLPDEYDSNLYKMFNMLLYPDDYIESSSSDDFCEQGNSLDIIAPILTIVFDEIDESTENIYLPEGVEIPLEFYPQLYTKNCKDQLIRHIMSKRRDAQIRSKEILQEIADLKSFQGKDILKFLNSTLEYLDNDKSKKKLSTEISHLKATLTEKKTQKMDEYKELLQKLNNEWNLSKPDLHIITTAKQLGLIDKPYYLSMVVISPYLYYIKVRNADWYLVQSKTTGSDFDTRRCSSPLEIQDAIKQYTRNASEYPLMFIYSKEGMYPSSEDPWEIVEQNEGCLSFVKADQLSLNERDTDSEE